MFNNTMAMILIMITIFWLLKTPSVLSLLIILELLTIIAITLAMKSMTSTDMTLLMVLLTLAALEASMGLSILVSFSRSFGSDRMDTKKMVLC
uniref:NADH dehydrogenase subunit 4L n=1 Tax=Iheyomytilidicola lauensis TaxID=998671 RepID=UPI001EE05543|nr:NADH dehydrogenase subunit 4L [Iheyomytilidicola lauensis]UJV31461.1 NADH dehydrogenase subunit 4L [Iheyomytilidicola lauensis]